MLGNSLTNGGEWHELLGNPKVVNRGISSDIAMVSNQPSSPPSSKANRPKVIPHDRCQRREPPHSADSIATDIEDCGAPARRHTRH